MCICVIEKGEKEMRIKFNEAGRSMVEMLGVLAVLGVLSIAGILGYKFAMNKYIANKNEAEKTENKKEMPSFMQKLFGKK